MGTLHNTPVVAISSTALDLPEHRRQIMDACLRLGFFPKMMEHLPASSDNAVAISLALIDSADVYIGVFAGRYGYIPAGEKISITEMEYERARQRGIPCLLFLMDDNHPCIQPSEESSESLQKLRDLKSRLRNHHVVPSFTSPEDLRCQVIQSLAELRLQLANSQIDAANDPGDGMPRQPAPYVAHAYSLLQTPSLVGRADELGLLDDWFQNPSPAVLCIVAMGGVGKSALLWSWFCKLAKENGSKLEGAIWWSFYEEGATFENFVRRALAYVAQKSLSQVDAMDPFDRQQVLLDHLNSRPFLIAFDGLERLLHAYSSVDQLLKDPLSVDATASPASDAIPVPVSIPPHLRKTADFRVGRILKRLAALQTSKVVISSRLFPHEFEAQRQEPISGCRRIDLRGLTPNDGLNLWTQCGSFGDRDELLAVFRKVDFHPLFIQVLATLVANFRSAPGDFMEWRKATPTFAPHSLPLVQVKSHILEHSLKGLTGHESRCLQVISALRMPATFDSLNSLLVRRDVTESAALKMASTSELDQALSNLEGRGLIGWDRRPNRYDAHPIVRGVALAAVPAEVRNEMYEALSAYFQQLSQIPAENAKHLEDLQPSIEVFNCYIKLHQFPAAYYRYVSDMRPFFRKKSLHLQLRADLLSELFPAGLEDYPLVGSADRGSLYNEMAQCLQFGGQPGKATALFRRAVQAAVSKSMRQGCCIGLGNLAYASLEAGRLRNAECAAGIGLVNLRLKADGIVPVTLFERADIEYPLYIRLATAMAIRGQDKDALVAFKRARRIQKCIHSQDYDLWVELGRFHLRRQRMDIVAQIVGHIGTWAKDDHDEYNQCHSVMLSGEMAMCQGQTAEARRLLNDALVQTRVWSHIANELRCLTLLARLEHQHGNVDGARALLADFWDPAERGPYLVHLANAFNLLSEIEQSTGHRDAAVEAAVRAYEAAWCDGPPYSYKYGLQASKRQLDSLGTQPPQLPAFDASKHEDAPNFRLDPPDEFSLKKFKRTRHRVHEEMLRRIKRRFGGDSKK